MNSGNLTTSGRGWPTGYHATIQKIQVFQLWVKANFPINVCKIKNFIGHKLWVLFMWGKEGLNTQVE